MRTKNETSTTDAAAPDMCVSFIPDTCFQNVNGLVFININKIEYVIDKSLRVFVWRSLKNDSHVLFLITQLDNYLGYIWYGWQYLSVGVGK
jgi:hypothetical protein